MPELLPGVASAFVAATATGFLGSLHCIGMCGSAAASIIIRGPVTAASNVITPIQMVPFSANAVGVNGTLGAAMEASGRIFDVGAIGGSARKSLVFNAGRIASYIVAGTLVAGIASSLAGRVIMHDAMPLRLALYIAGQCMVIATGFYIAGYTKPLAPFERIGRFLWRFLQQWMAPLLSGNRMRGRGNLFLVGALWGWIPCGMVYATLATAMASGSANSGALVMFGFGLGTLPAMFAAGIVATPLHKMAQQPNIRIAAGAVVIALGLFGLSRSGSLADYAALGEFCTSAIATVFSGATR